MGTSSSSHHLPSVSEHEYIPNTTSTSTTRKTSGRQSHAQSHILDTSIPTEHHSAGHSNGISASANTFQSERHHSGNNSGDNSPRVEDADRVGPNANANAHSNSNSNSTPPPQLQLQQQSAQAQAPVSGVVTRSTRRANRTQHLQQAGPATAGAPLVPPPIPVPVALGSILSGRAQPTAASIGRVSIAPISVLDRHNEPSKASSAASGSDFRTFWFRFRFVSAQSSVSLPVTSTFVAA